VADCVQARYSVSAGYGCRRLSDKDALYATPQPHLPFNGQNKVRGSPLLHCSSLIIRKPAADYQLLLLVNTAVLLTHKLRAEKLQSHTHPEAAPSSFIQLENRVEAFEAA
jgi:hypothetical protein